MKNRNLLRIAVITCSMIIPVIFAVAQKPQARLRLSFVQNDSAAYLVSRVTTRVDKRYEAVAGAHVIFSMGGELLGESVTEEDGDALFVLPDSFSDIQGLVKFEAEIKNDSKVADKMADLEVLRSTIMLKPQESGDSVRQIRLRFMAMSDSAIVPIPEVQVQFYIKRMFSLLPVGGDYNFTDDEGNLVLDFPDDILADTLGGVTLVAQVTDHDLYGTVSGSISVPWGIGTAGELNEERTLWAARSSAPWTLLLFANLFLLMVWGIIVYLILQLVQIRNLGKKPHNVHN